MLCILTHRQLWLSKENYCYSLGIRIKDSQCSESYFSQKSKIQLESFDLLIGLIGLVWLDEPQLMMNLKAVIIREFQRAIIQRDGQSDGKARTKLQLGSKSR